MFRLLFSILLTFGLLACAKDKETESSYTFIARVSAFDLNCEICVLEFPNDSIIVKELVGETPYNKLYNAVNLSMNDFEIGESIVVTIRKPQGDELKACKTLYASYTNQNIYIISFKKM
jgi:hypothetical protein